MRVSPDSRWREAAAVAVIKGEQRHGGVDHLDRAGDHARAPPKPGKPMPLAGVVAFAVLRLILADVVPPDRQGLIIGRGVVGAEQTHAPALQALDQAVQRALVAAAALPIDQPARPALEGLPDPEVSGLSLTKCQTASISPTPVPPRAGSGLGPWACA